MLLSLRRYMTLRIVSLSWRLLSFSVVLDVGFGSMLSYRRRGQAHNRESRVYSVLARTISRRSVA